jgi:hypothetical protein
LNLDEQQLRNNKKYVVTQLDLVKEEIRYHLQYQKFAQNLFQISQKDFSSLGLELKVRILASFFNAIEDLLFNNFENELFLALLRFLSGVAE